MSESVFFPSIFEPSIESPSENPPLEGRVERIRRRPGHYAKLGEPVVDIRIGSQMLTLCAVQEGKIMRCREVGEAITAGDAVFELTSVGTPTWEVFVAYRHSDSPGHAGRIADRLMEQLGPGQVFRDIESLPKGPDYVEIVRARLQTVFIMIVVIGPRWADARLHNPDDLHREELRTALQRGIHVQPVFVDGAAMPHERDLPEDLQPVSRRNAIEIRDTRWDSDIRELLDVVEGTLDHSPRRRAFLAQVPQPPWTPGPRLQFVEDDPLPR